MTHTYHMDDIYIYIYVRCLLIMDGESRCCFSIMSGVRVSSLGFYHHIPSMTHAETLFMIIYFLIGAFLPLLSSSLFPMILALRHRPPPHARCFL